MRRWVALSGLVVVVAACAPNEVASTTTTAPIETTTTTRSTTTTTAGVTTTTAPPPGGFLVRLDMDTLQPAAGLEPIPMAADSWNFLSGDGSVLVNVDCDQNLCDLAKAIHVDSWQSWGPVDVGWHAARAADGSTFYGYDDRAGSTGRGLFSVGFKNGEELQLAEWKHSLYFWDELHVLPGGLIAGLGTAPAEVVDDVTQYSVYVYDPASGEEVVIPVGPLERADQHSGVFDGEYEIPVFDSPGVAWGEDRLYIVHAEDLEVTEVDLATGSVQIHQVDVSTWLDRLLGFWMPTASAKGPSMGTYSSAALSTDGRFLFVSGNRMNVETSQAGGLVEVEEHLGLTVVDTETWRLLESPDLTIQHVRKTGGQVIGVDTVSTNPWISEVYLFDIDPTRLVSYLGPVTQRDGGGCVSARDDSQLVCTDYQGGGANVHLIDSTTMSSLTTIKTGDHDVVHAIGVMEDWLPSNLP
jgi:hypothetical protein